MHAACVLRSFYAHERVLYTPNESHELDARSETIADVRPTSCVDSYVESRLTHATLEGPQRRAGFREPTVNIGSVSFELNEPNVG